MAYYHPSEEAARETANQLVQDPRIAMVNIQFEPYNGWLVVLVPARYDLSDLTDRAEIQDGKRRAPPVAKIKPKPVGESTQAHGGRQSREQIPTLKVDPASLAFKPAWLK